MSSYHSLISFSTLGTTVYSKINLYERSLNLSEPPLFLLQKIWGYYLPNSYYRIFLHSWVIRRKKHKQLLEVWEFLKKVLNKHLWCICPSSWLAIFELHSLSTIYSQISALGQLPPKFPASFRLPSCPILLIWKQLMKTKLTPTLSEA